MRFEPGFVGGGFKNEYLFARLMLGLDFAQQILNGCDGETDSPDLDPFWGPFNRVDKESSMRTEELQWGAPFEKKQLLNLFLRVLLFRAKYADMALSLVLLVYDAFVKRYPRTASDRGSSESMVQLAITCDIARMNH